MRLNEIELKTAYHLAQKEDNLNESLNRILKNYSNYLIILIKRKFTTWGDYF